MAQGGKRKTEAGCLRPGFEDRACPLCGADRPESLLQGRFDDPDVAGHLAAFHNSGFPFFSDNGSVDEIYGVGITVSGAVGYRFYSAKATIYPSAQLAPYVDIVIPTNENSNYYGFGLLALLVLGFHG